MINKLRMLSSTIAFLLLLTTFAFGQETTGSIEGTVSDPSGGRLPGVSVTITGIDQGFNRTLTSDSEGFFRLTAVHCACPAKPLRGS